MPIEQRGGRTCLIVSLVPRSVPELTICCLSHMASSIEVSSEKSDSVKQVSALTRGGDISIRFLRKRGLWSLAVLRELKSGGFLSAELR